ncbi:oligosaccharide flippase family protein [Paenibacillus sp. N1-5-1-14]|uniref:putative polysaccharide biosynthesis protein n=1 Tax=Paenibacillus radicibacter TaxID=2972488 RepID=UPI0021596EE6|nr:oligosaccharide flippase family protein [Paenibacillus radicibacter]MCR8645862.1 oligosaccharide flippase family protein [Paenibacillus radicibacter]
MARRQVSTPSDNKSNRKMDSKWFKGAAILAIAAIVSKLLGTLQKIPMQNIAGDEAYGLYSAVYPLYLFIVFLATAGLPTTVAAFVSERVALGDHYGARRVIGVSSVLLSLSGVLFFILTYFGADLIASLIGVAGTAPAIRAVSWAMLLIPLMSVYRGYFQGYQQMTAPAVSQVVEQLVRVIGMLIMLWLFVRAGEDAATIAAGGMFGSVIGAIGGLAVMLYYWWRLGNAHKVTVKIRRNSQKRARFGQEDTAVLARRMIRYAIPVCLGTITVPLLNIVDTFTMPRLLHDGASGADEAMRQFGLYNHGLPLVQLVAMIVSAMGAAIVPALAEAKASGEHVLLRQRMNTAINLTWLIGLPAAVGLALTAEPVNVMLFATAEGTGAMAILAFAAIFSTLNIVTTSVLNGIGVVRAPAVHMLIAVVVKVAGNLVLVPALGIAGGAIAAVAAFAVSAALNLVRVYTPRTDTLARLLGSRAVTLPIVASGVMGAAVLALLWAGEAGLAAAGHPLPERLAATALTLVAVVVGAAVYAGALIRLKVLDISTLEHMPVVYKRLKPFMKKR